MRRVASLSLLGATLALGAPVPGAAQAGPDFLEVGEMAPDFEVAAATRYGVIDQPVKLSDLRGETVVLTYFFRARTRG